MKKHCFFDLDGTLADTDADIRVAWKAAMQDMGLECPSFDRDFVAGPPIEEMAKRLFGPEYTDDLGAELRKRFGIRYDNGDFAFTREYPGVMDAVRKIKAAGASVYIATNKRFAGAAAILRKFDWGGTFDGLFAGDMLSCCGAGPKMKKPQLLAWAMGRMGATASESVMIGDTANDFTAAKENGIASIAVSWGYGKPGELELAGKTVRTAEELARVIIDWSEP